MWDERFPCPAHKEADYYLRALIYNKEKSLIADKAHQRYLNCHDYLPIEKDEYRGGDSEWREFSKKGEDSKEAWYLATQIFYYKWKDSWKEQPAYFGWVNGWTKEFLENPPVPTNTVNFVQYPYFEKNIELKDKNYVGYRAGDLWFDCESFNQRINKYGDIDEHPFLEGKFRE